MKTGLRPVRGPPNEGRRPSGHQHRGPTYQGDDVGVCCEALRRSCFDGGPGTRASGVKGRRSSAREGKRPIGRTPRVSRQASPL